MSTITLLTLPAEIREKIYAFVVEDIAVDFTIFSCYSFRCNIFKTCADPAHTKTCWRFKYQTDCRKHEERSKISKLHLVCRTLRAEFLPCLGKLTSVNVQLDGWYQLGRNSTEINYEPDNLPTEQWRASVRRVTFSLSSLRDCTTLDWDQLFPGLEHLTLNVRDSRYSQPSELINVPLRAEYVNNNLMSRLGMYDLKLHANRYEQHHCASGGVSRRWTFNVKFALGSLQRGYRIQHSPLFHVTLSEQKIGETFHVTVKLADSELCPELSGDAQPKGLKMRITGGYIYL